MPELGRQVRLIRTPEGISLPFEIGSVVDRALAFGLDFIIIHGTLLVLLLLAGLFTFVGFGYNVMAVFLLVSFFLRNFYFTFLELKWGGATIGKRALGLRVISRDGGPVTAEAIFARNLTRDMEIFLPLTALLMPQQFMPGVPAWGVLIGSVWLLVFAGLPLFNKDRLRCGDIVGGTLVVRMPKAKLLPDLAESAEILERRESYSFTQAQLDLYGIHELQILEDILRRSDPEKDNELLSSICQKIMKKIGWPKSDETVALDFLMAFYRAQRGRLEHKALFGVRQEKKK
jgi:uncharacterized RDD family membrane protein YckC